MTTHTTAATATPTKRSFYDRVKHGLRDRLVSAFIPVIALGNVINPVKESPKDSSNNIHSTEYSMKVNAKALDLYLQQNTGEHYKPGDVRQDAIVSDNDLTSTELKVEADELIGKKLSLDEQFAKADKAELRKAVYADFLKELADIKTAASPELDREIAPIVGNSFDDMKITSHYQKMRKMRYRGHDGKMHTRKSRHRAVDIKLQKPSSAKTARHNQAGEEVHAPAKGKILLSKISSGSTGKIVIKDDHNVVWTFFDVQTLKESGLNLVVGDSVKAGQVFSKFEKPRGGEAINTGAHVHVAASLNGVPLNTEKMLTQDGYMGEIEQSPLAKQLGPELVAMLKADPTGEKFEEMATLVKEKFSKKITPEVVVEMSLASLNKEEGGYNRHTNTNHGVTKSAMGVKKYLKHGRTIGTLKASQIDEIQRGYVATYAGNYMGEAVDTLTDKKAMATKLAMLPIVIDAVYNHNPDNAMKMVDKSNDDPHLLVSLRKSHVRNSHKISRADKKHLYGRYDHVEDLSDQIYSAVMNNDGYMITNQKYAKTMKNYGAAEKVLEKKEKALFTSQYGERNIEMKQALADLDLTRMMQKGSPLDDSKYDDRRLAGLFGSYRQAGSEMVRPSAPVTRQRGAVIEIVVDPRQQGWAPVPS